MKKTEDWKTIVSYDEIQEHHKWDNEIPAIQFKSEWKVKIIPPFGGAVSRFRVIFGNASVSVYLDCYDRLAIVGSPYWEVYPYEDDVYRVGIGDTQTLVDIIQQSINQQLGLLKPTNTA